MQTVLLLRHGERIWSVENLLPGWTDVDLCEKGRQETFQTG